MSKAPNLERARHRMVRDQLESRGLHSPRVLEAMGRVPRERFLPYDYAEEAYSDRALSIECGQTISQPYMVALMTDALRLEGSERVLEIGTGSGYQTAVLAELAAEVITIERHEDLSRQARAVHDELGYENITYVVGDGTLGWLDAAPYERILVTAAAQQAPQPLLDQLAEGGVLVMPIGGSQSQVLQQVTKRQGQPRWQALTPCRFVPLIGQEGEPR